MDEMPTDGFRHRPLWFVAVAGLLCAQAGLELSLFGPQRSVAALLDERPVLSGRHPLHLYHGSLGAQSFRATRTTTCYDPSFQAGYPKTPIFDGGCRPAELFLALAGGEFNPAAYKVGLFVCLLLIPLAFVLVGRGAGLPVGASVLAGACGTLLCWSWPVRRLVEEGEIDFLMAGIGMVVFVAWMARYARWPGIDSCAVLAVVAAAGWYAHPVVWIALGPIVVGYYLVFAPRRGLAWHLGLLGVTAAGLAPNLWWLADWGRYWWLRQPSPSDNIPLPEWQAVLGASGDYLTLLGCTPGGAALVAAGAVGLVMLWRSGNRAAAGLFVVAVAVCVVVARLLAAWPRVPADAPDRVVPLAAALLVVPAALGAWKVLERGQLAAVGAVVAVLGLLVVGWADGPERPLASAAGLRTDPAVVGLSDDQRAVVAALRDHTTAEARILWDDTTDHRPGWNWTALLPVLTDRAYLGGLDHEAGMEYSFCGMREGRLNGRQLSLWTDAELAAFCHWYNVGWVVCRGSPAADRWGKLPMARAIARLKEGGQPVTVFALDRPRSFVLSGSAKWEEATPTRISLTDVTPDASGYVVLSLHHMEGMRIYPSYVNLPDRDRHDATPSSPDPTGRDPINHIKLLVPGPVPRITIVWEGP